MTTIQCIFHIIFYNIIPYPVERKVAMVITTAIMEMARPM